MTPTGATNRPGNRSPARRAAAPRGELVRRLLHWYRRVRRPLPWRATRDPYRIWLSEVLLQQTRVAAALPYYERFLESFPDLASLADASEEAVLKRWEGIGYYRRARHLHRAARWLVRERAGAWPSTAREWRELPGVGEYTAGAVASIAFGERAPAVDGNASRVLARLFALPRPLEDAATRRELRVIASSLVPARSPGEWNQALMELGARICIPRHPRCNGCPVRAHCSAAALGRQDKIPRTRRRAAVPRRKLVAVALESRGSLLLARRRSDGMLAGMWELPTVERKPRESTLASLERALREGAGMEARRARSLAARVDAPVTRVDHGYSHFTAEIHVYRCSNAVRTVHGASRGRRRGRRSQEDEAPYDAMRWVAPAEAAALPVHAAARKALAALAFHPSRSPASRTASSP